MVLSEVVGAAPLQGPAIGPAPAPAFAFGDILLAILLVGAVAFGIVLLVRKLRGPIEPRHAKNVHGGATDAVLPLPFYDRVLSCDVCVSWWSIVGTLLVWGSATHLPLTKGTSIIAFTIAAGAEGFAVFALAALGALKGEKIPPPT